MQGVIQKLVVTLALGAAIVVHGAAPGAVSVQSPDRQVKVEVVLNGGRPHWSAWFKGTRFIEEGLLGVETAPDNFSGMYERIGVETASGDSTWKPVWGNLSVVPDRYNEMTVKLKETAGAGRVFHIIVRAYNEGIGLRYQLPVQPNVPKITLKRRLTEYRFATDHTIYQNRNYEYGNAKISTMSRSEGAVTIALDEGRFATLTDADRTSFPITFWHNRKESPNTVLGRLGSQAEGQPPFDTSWEVILLGETTAKLYENRHLVENLNPPCAIADTSWIRPGEAISQIRNTRMVTGELQKLMDFASSHNVEYVEIDHSWCGAETKWTPEEIAFFDKNKGPFWADKPEWRANVVGNPRAPAKGWVPFRPKSLAGGNYVELDMPELASYGKKLNPPVGLCVYLRAAVVKEFGGEHPADEIFDVYQKWGLAGIKIGFVPCGSQQAEAAIVDVVRKAANHKLIVNIHDGYLPSGLSRTYPNLMNVEGLAGDESEHSIDAKIKSLHDVLLPFTRGLMGPLDYTPEMFKKAKTHAHQVAMLGVYHGRPSIRGGMKQWSPGGEGGKEIEFLKKLPGLFDELKVFTQLGEYVTVARRSGDAWFVASMADGTARSYPLPLTFLKNGVNYAASIYTDTPGSQKTAHSTKTVSSDTILTIDMQPNGGHLMILEPLPPGATGGTAK